MNFEVNGETYYLDLADDARRWHVLVSTETGARPIPVYEDAAEFKGYVVIAEDQDRHRIPN